MFYLRAREIFVIDTCSVIEKQTNLQNLIFQYEAIIEKGHLHHTSILHPLDIFGSVNVVDGNTWRLGARERKMREEVREEARR